MIDEKELPNLLSRKGLSQTDALLLCLATDPELPRSVSAIREIARNAGVRSAKDWNVSARLAASDGCVNLPTGWKLNDAGKLRVRQIFAAQDAPSVVLISKLRGCVAKIGSPETKAFVEEAVCAFEFGLFRSAVVLSWVGAVSVLYHHVCSSHLAAFNAEAPRYVPAWRAAKTVDDLSLMKEAAFLEVLAAIGVLNKNIKEHLKNNCLAMRNAAGHPNTFAFGPAQVEAHIEHLILNIYQRF